MKPRFNTLYILLLVLASQSSLAGSYTIPKTYTSGDTLTATDLNNENTAIKSAVDDNNNRIASMFSGDGSAGDLTITASINWETTLSTNPNFNNIVIDAGQNLTVPAGTIIRCAGTFTNNGTLTVSPGAETDGTYTVSAGGPTMGLVTAPHPGDTPRAATNGMYTNDAGANPKALYGGLGGRAIPKSLAVTSFSYFRIGGGSGAGYDNQGNRGGGLVKIYCQGAITNNGTINANGQPATNTSIGGGGGGIVILASRTLVDNSSGTINANGGGAAGTDGNFAGNGGGGGGGIVILASPTTPVTGTENVTAGAGATGTATVSSDSRFAGAGGGGSGGAGGSGGSVSSTGVKSNGGNGGTGYVITLQVDPAAIAH